MSGHHLQQHRKVPSQELCFSNLTEWIALTSRAMKMLSRIARKNFTLLFHWRRQRSEHHRNKTTTDPKFILYIICNLQNVIGCLVNPCSMMYCRSRAITVIAVSGRILTQSYLSGQQTARRFKMLMMITHAVFLFLS